MVSTDDTRILSLSSGFESLSDQINKKVRTLLQFFRISTACLPGSGFEARYPLEEGVVCLKMVANCPHDGREYSFAIVRPHREASSPVSYLPAEEILFQAIVVDGFYSCSVQLTPEDSDSVVSCLNEVVPYFRFLSRQVISKNLYPLCVEVLEAHSLLWQWGASLELSRGDYLIRMMSSLKPLLHSSEREGRLEILRRDWMEPILVLGAKDIEVASDFTANDLVQLKGILSKELKVMLKG